jgi:hypothetical protein
MMLQVNRLTPELEKSYEAFVRSVPNALFFSSLGYRNLLKKFLGAEDHYFIAQKDDGQILGVLPSFIKDVPGRGSVANSLPFYGSHGGVITANNNKQVVSALLTHFRDFVEDRGCLSSTVITSPFDEDLSLYEECTGFTTTDSRIGQLTLLPERGDNSAQIVMDSLHQKTRNMVRKAEKQGISVSDKQWQGGINFLAETHADNMEQIGGMAKPIRFFELVESTFVYGTDYRIYTAWHDNEPVAALLLFYFKDTVEYFTPVIVQQHRSNQPLSLLIHRAMSDAVDKGFRWWNWGGTWHTQEGVYQFKRSWRAIDMPYKYFTTVMDQKVLDQSKAELLNDYPFFYVVPFSILKT